MSTDIRQTMRALVIEQIKKPVVQSDRPVPKPQAGQILVKVSHVALNPTDWKHLDSIGAPDSIIGCDFYGTVAGVGPEAAKFEVGDRVNGVVHGGKFSEKGSFAEYLVTPENITFATPKAVGDAEAATYGIGFGTAAMTLFHDQGYSYPLGEQKEQRDGWFLVSGGSTSVGLFTLALLRYLGVKSIATASPHSFDLLKSFGADHVVDYHDKDAAIAEIKKVSGGGVVGGLECVGGEVNFNLSVRAFGEKGGLLTCLLPPSDKAKAIREDVRINNILLYTAMGKASHKCDVTCPTFDCSFEFIPGRPPLPAMPEVHEWYKDLIKRAEGDQGLMTQIKANPVDLRGGGFDGITDGFELMRQNKVSGRKLVYKVST